MARVAQGDQDRLAAQGEVRPGTKHAATFEAAGAAHATWTAALEAWWVDRVAGLEGWSEQEMAAAAFGCPLCSRALADLRVDLQQWLLSLAPP